MTATTRGNTNFSTPGGLYDWAKRKAGADVFSAEGFIDVGNADIKGKLFTGPFNSGQVSVGPYGSVGDLNWVGPGIQPGWYFENFRFALPDISPPFASGPPPMGDVTNLSLLGSAAYMYDGNFSANSAATIRVVGNATVYVTGTLDCKGKIIVEPGASLKLYVGGAYTRLNQVLTDGQPTRFTYYGLASNVGISWSGNEDYAACVYAPQATLRLGGGGAESYEFSGACVVSSVIINGSFDIHFDENLMRIGPMR